MTRRDRLRAFALRCDGMTWVQIGSILHYDAQTVAKDLRSALEKPPHTPNIIYPAIKRHVQQNCRGSVEIFARQLGVSPYRLRRVLQGIDRPSAALLRKILTATSLSEAAAFDTRKDETMSQLILKDPLRDPQAEAPVCSCGACLGEVYRGETLFEWEQKKICPDCFRQKISDWLEQSPEQLADALDFRHSTAGEEEPL